MSEKNNTIQRTVIISDSIPDRNGVGSYYQDLIAHLNGSGHKVTIICPREDRPSLLRFPMPGDVTQRVWIPSLWRFRRIIRSVNPEVIVVATPGPFGLLGCWWAKRLKARLIVGFHTDYAAVTDMLENPILKYSSRFYFDMSNAYLFRHSQLVLANSVDARETAYAKGARNIEIIGTLLPLEALKPIDSSRPDAIKKVIFAGRLSPEKQVPALLEAAGKLPEISFVIAGDGPLRATVEQAVSQMENVSYLGWLGRAQLFEEIDSSDLLILPSTLESFGTVALEAMARARLVLVSAECGIVDWPELAEHIFQIGKGQSIDEAIKSLAMKPAESLRSSACSAGDAARQLNRESFDHWLKLLGICRTESS